MNVNAHQIDTDCTGKIPPGATALSLNVTALNSTSNSFLTIWPGGAQPVASALNPAPGARVFNAVTTELSGDQTFSIYNNRGNTDVFIDVNGYYENHNHDDRYDTKGQVDGKIDAAIAGQPWKIRLSAFDLVGPSGGFPAPTTGSGVIGYGMGYNDGVFGRAWFGFGLPDNYSPGTDVDTAAIAGLGAGTPVRPMTISSASTRPTHRRTGNTDIYFVANTRPESLERECVFRVTGKTAELWDPETGVVHALPYHW